MFKRIAKPVSISVIAVFLVNTVIAQTSFAQLAFLPNAGSMVALTPKYNPMVVKGIQFNPKNPFQFNFIVDTGDTAPNNQEIEEEGQKLISYFLASLTTPEKDMWVNLSPYEKNRVIPTNFGQTVMGKELLAQDYMLKQIMATALYPEKKLGQEFWQKVYAQSSSKFGTTNLSVNTFNKVWIVPQKAVVHENKATNSVFVVDSSLKVMLEKDYLASTKNTASVKESVANDVPSRIIKEIVIPALEKEVNEGKNFASLRQVYQSLILAAWYKKNLTNNILVQGYANRNKNLGVNVDDQEITKKIYQQYLQAYRKGVYNFVKEENDPATNKAVARKYFSGGITAVNVGGSLRPATLVEQGRFSNAMISRLGSILILSTAALFASAFPTGANAADRNWNVVHPDEIIQIGETEVMINSNDNLIGAFASKTGLSKLEAEKKLLGFIAQNKVNVKSPPAPQAVKLVWGRSSVEIAKAKAKAKAAADAIAERARAEEAERDAQAREELKAQQVQAEIKQLQAQIPQFEADIAKVETSFEDAKVKLSKLLLTGGIEEEKKIFQNMDSFNAEKKKLEQKKYDALKRLAALSTPAAAGSPPPPDKDAFDVQIKEAFNDRIAQYNNVVLLAGPDSLNEKVHLAKLELAKLQQTLIIAEGSRLSSLSGLFQSGTVKKIKDLKELIKVLVAQQKIIQVDRDALVAWRAGAPAPAVFPVAVVAAAAPSGTASAATGVVSAAPPAPAALSMNEKYNLQEKAPEVIAAVQAVRNQATPINTQIKEADRTIIFEVIDGILKTPSYISKAALLSKLNEYQAKLDAVSGEVPAVNLRSQLTEIVGRLIKKIGDPALVANDPTKLPQVENDALGGIDLQSMALQSNGEGIQTAFDDPALLNKLEKADGLFSVIYKITPGNAPMINALIGG